MFHHHVNIPSQNKYLPYLFNNLLYLPDPRISPQNLKSTLLAIANSLSAQSTLICYITQWLVYKTVFISNESTCLVFQ